MRSHVPFLRSCFPNSKPSPLQLGGDFVDAFLDARGIGGHLFEAGEQKQRALQIACAFLEVGEQGEDWAVGERVGLGLARLMFDPALDGEF